MKEGDNFLYKGLRLKLVELLREKGITSEAVLNAIASVPRHLFVLKGFEHLAYEDKPLPIEEGQTISQSYTVAFQTELLTIIAGEKVLEIGTGSGYQAAILAEMGARVFSIERLHRLYMNAQHRLKSLGYNVRLFYGDGYEGKAAFAPYDKIIVTAGAREIPESLLSQLKPGGKMVIPLGENIQEMVVVHKDNNENITLTKHGSFVFVPFVKGK
jgi:protein-L-isoaspartate(D-aspartate) O-methyltransferase